MRRMPAKCLKRGVLNEPRTVPKRPNTVVIPSTIAKPLFHSPIEPAKMIGNTGRMHGETIDTTPARKTSRYTMSILRLVSNILKGYVQIYLLK